MSSKKNDYIDDEAETSSSLASFINDGTISMRSWTSGDDDENCEKLSDTSDAIYFPDGDEQVSSKAETV